MTSQKSGSECCDDIKDDILRYLCCYILEQEETDIDCQNDGDAIGLVKKLKEFPDEQYVVYIRIESQGFYLCYVVELVQISPTASSEQTAQTYRKLLEAHLIKNQWKIAIPPSADNGTVILICQSKKNMDNLASNGIEFVRVLYDLRELLLWLYANELL